MKPDELPGIETVVDTKISGILLLQAVDFYHEEINYGTVYSMPFHTVDLNYL